jgi:hypothetical protein
MNAPVQCAVPSWLESRGEIQKQILARVTVNLAEMDRQLTRAPMLRRLDAEGGWYAVLRIPAFQPDERTVLELLNCGVWIHPGYFFGMTQSGWLVLSLLAPEQELSTGVTKLVNYFNTNQASKNF